VKGSYQPKAPKAFPAGVSGGTGIFKGDLLLSPP